MSGGKASHASRSKTYDVGAHGFMVVTLTSWKSTVLPYVLELPGFWLMFILHLAIWVSLQKGWLHQYEHYFEANGAFSIDAGHTKIVSGFTVFFEVFYTGQCYTRYFAMGNLVNDVFTNTHMFIMIFKAYLKDCNVNYCRLISRWMRAAVLLHFHELQSGPTDSEYWDRMCLLGVVRRDERAMLEGLNNTERLNKLLQWCMHTTHVAYNSVPKPPGPPCLAGMIEHLAAWRRSQISLLQCHRMPVPYVYFHLLNAMVLVTCFLWAFAMAANPSYFGPIIYCLAALLCIGMLEVAKTLSDPFGDDQVDFPLADWFDMFMPAHSYLVEDSFPSGFLEVALREEKAIRPPAAGSIEELLDAPGNWGNLLRPPQEVHWTDVIEDGPPHSVRSLGQSESQTERLMRGVAPRLINSTTSV